jgi:hypothetical protein
MLYNAEGLESHGLSSSEKSTTVETTALITYSGWFLYLASCEAALDPAVNACICINICQVIRAVCMIWRLTVKD